MEKEKQPTHQLHCGACGLIFDNDDFEGLNQHLDNCPVALFMTPCVDFCVKIGERMGHGVSVLIRQVSRNQQKINDYISVVYHIRVGMEEERGKRHKTMCECLGIKYTDFKPFDNVDRNTLLTFEGAKIHFYNELLLYAVSLMNRTLALEGYSLRKVGNGFKIYKGKEEVDLPLVGM